MNYIDCIGENIKSLRLSQGLSQQDLAEKCGFSNTMLSQYENGRKTPSLVTTANIAKALNVSINRLYYGDENIAFINAEPDDGRKIVNSIYLLWEKGIISYFEYYSYGFNPLDGMENNDNEKEINKTGIFLHIVEHAIPIKRLIIALNEFKERQDTYPDPNAYLEMLLASVASEINKETALESSRKAQITKPRKNRNG
jgi:transcriptional regulator with XRE-family HTH domain